MSVVAARSPKVHLVKRLENAQRAPDHTPLQLLLLLMCRAASDAKRARLHRQLVCPTLISKRTYWELYQIGLEMKREGAAYHLEKLEEVRRLMDATPEWVKRAVHTPTPI